MDEQSLSLTERQMIRRRLIVTAIKLNDAGSLAKLLMQYRAADPTAEFDALTVCEEAITDMVDTYIRNAITLLQEVRLWTPTT